MRHRIAIAATAISMSVLPALLAQAPPSGKKQGPPEKSPPPELLGKLPDSLEEMLSAALQSNPEILQAEARVEQAQARLNQVRLKVSQEVASVFHEREKLREVVLAQQREVEVLFKQQQVGRVDESQYQAGLSRRNEAQSQLA